MDETSQLRALLDGAQRHEYDEVFNRLAHGELSDNETEALRTNPDPEIRRLYELFRPFDAAATQRFEEAVSRGLARQARQDSSRLAPRATLSMQPKRRLRKLTAVMLPLAAAAGIAVVFMHRRHEPLSSLDIHPMDAPVEYSKSGETLLGDGGPRPERIQLRAGTCWAVQLSTKKADVNPKLIRAFFVRGDTAQPWHVTFETLPNGRLRMQGSCAKLPALVPGDWSLVVFSGSDAPTLAPATAAAFCKQDSGAAARERCRGYPIVVRSSPTDPK